jgi:hypothetical protein
MSNQVATISINDIERMAVAVAKSRLFGVKTADEALALMLVAQAEGRHPALAARDYDIIQGRPAKKSEAMLRDFLESGGKVEWHKLDNDIADATFSHPAGGTVRIGWDMKRASAAGLGAKDMWRKYPRQMLRARCVSEGIRTVCPMATSGMYVPEEVHDFTSNITPTAGASENVTSDSKQKCDDLAVKVTEWLNSGSVADAVMEIENAGLESEEKIYLWTLFDSKQRSAMKKEAKRQKDEMAAKAIQGEAQTVTEEPQGESVEVISTAQHKRLEARIKELGLNRDVIKKWCVDNLAVAHLNEIRPEQYDRVDSMITDMAEFQS